MSNTIQVLTPPLSIVKNIQTTETELETNYRTTSTIDSPVEILSSVISERWVFRITARVLLEGQLDQQGWRRWRAYFNESKSFRALHRMWASSDDRPFQTQPLDNLTAGESIMETRTNQEPYYDQFTVEPVGSRATTGASALKYSHDVTLQGLKANNMALLPGTFFTIYHGPQNNIPMLYQCVQQAYTDNQGKTTFRVVPGLRENIVVGQPVRFFRPESIFQLQLFDSQVDAPNIGSAYYEVIEIPEVLAEPDSIML